LRLIGRMLPSAVETVAESGRAAFDAGKVACWRSKRRAQQPDDHSDTRVGGR
jgi:hypothetical protein